MTKAEALAYLRRKQLLEKKLSQEEQLYTHRETEETMREFEKTSDENLTTEESNV